MNEPGKRKAKRQVGDVVRIALPSGRWAYGHVLKEPLVGIYEGVFTTELPLADVGSLRIAFRVWVHNDALRKNIWPVVGWLPLSQFEQEEPYLFKQDMITGRLSLYHSSFSSTGYERPAVLQECERLERAAVWDAAHVVDRIEDLAAGRENKWVKSMQIDRSRVPPEQR